MTRMADALIAEMLAAEIDTAFGVPGESYLDVLDAIAETDGRFSFITCRQEGGAAMAAEAHGTLTGKPGVCFVTRGPGATNASAGIHVARQDSTPMIIFIGQVETAARHREGFQEIDLEAMFRPIAKWVAEISDPARVQEYVARAIACATSGRPGPVVISLPEDILGAEITPAERKYASTPINAAPTQLQIERTAELLADAKRPLLIAGGGGWTERTSALLEAFADKYRIPIAAAWRRQDVIDNTHSAYVGHFAYGIDPALADAVHTSDLLIVLGARLGEATTSGYSLIDIPYPRQPMIHVHPDPSEIAQVYQPACGIAASIDEVLNHWNDVDAAPSFEDGWLAGLRSNYLEFSEPIIEQAPVEPALVMRHVSENLPVGVTVANGAGNYAIWLHRFFDYRHYGAQLAPTSGSMGYGLPGAIAAAVNHPDKLSLCIAGDGCFMMTCQEMATAVHHGLKVKVIVFNNSKYGTIRMHQEKTFPGRVLGTDLTNPDFAAFARAFGCYGEQVTSTDDFPAAFADLMAADGPGLIELLLDPAIIRPGVRLSA